MTELVTAAKQLLLPAPFGPMMPRISPDRTDQLTSRSATSAPYCTVRFSTRRTSSSPRRCGCSDVSTRPIQILFLSECCRARLVGRQAPKGRNDGEYPRRNGLFGVCLETRGSVTHQTIDGGFETPYRLRKQVVEPVFGQIKQARGFRQFLLRGA